MMLFVLNHIILRDGENIKNSLYEAISFSRFYLEKLTAIRKKLLDIWSMAMEYKSERETPFR